MARHPTIHELWDSAVPPKRAFDRAMIANLPDAARRYLAHAIAPGTPLASAVRLRMHGQIKFKGWLPFTSEQIIRWDRGMIWQANVRMNGLPVRGFDRLVDGVGEMRWKMLGLIPVAAGTGPDITRSAAGRLAAETIWLPSVLCREDVTWTEVDSSHSQAAITAAGEGVKLTLAVNEIGQLESTKLKRWGNPEGAAFHYADFGGVAEREGTFGGYTIPTQLSVGWHFGGDRFALGGEFFRCVVDGAQFR